MGLGFLACVVVFASSRAAEAQCPTRLPPSVIASVKRPELRASASAITVTWADINQSGGALNAIQQTRHQLAVYEAGIRQSTESARAISQNGVIPPSAPPNTQLGALINSIAIYTDGRTVTLGVIDVLQCWAHLPADARDQLPSPGNAGPDSPLQPGSGSGAHAPFAPRGDTEGSVGVTLSEGTGARYATLADQVRAECGAFDDAPPLTHDRAVSNAYDQRRDAYFACGSAVADRRYAVPRVGSGLAPGPSSLNRPRRPAPDTPEIRAERARLDDREAAADTRYESDLGELKGHLADLGNALEGDITGQASSPDAATSADAAGGRSASDFDFSKLDSPEDAASDTSADAAATDLAPLLQQRLDRLRALRSENDATFDELERQLEQDYKDSGVEEVSNEVDTATFVLQTLNEVGKIATQAYEGLELSGKALDDSNRELAKEALGLAYKEPAKMAAEHEADKQLETTTSNSATTLIATTVKLYEDVSTPSFWLTFQQTWLNDSSGYFDRLSTSLARGLQGPKGLLLQAKDHLETQRNSTNASLDAKIAETQRLLEQASNLGATPYLVTGGRGVEGYRLTLPAASITIEPRIALAQHTRY
jgi:hypothetical protein